MSETVSTKVSNQQALLQQSNDDGRALVSIVQEKSGHYRFVEEREMSQPQAGVVPEYSYWEETYRSGLFPTAKEALAAAEQEIAWMGKAPPPGRVGASEKKDFC